MDFEVLGGQATGAVVNTEPEILCVSAAVNVSATRTAACPSAGQSARMVQYNPADYTSLFWLNPILNHYQHTLEIPDCARGNTRQPNFVVT